MEAGQWEEAASLIAQAQLLFERGEASEADRRRGEQLMGKLREAREASEAAARALEALQKGVKSPTLAMEKVLSLMLR